VPIGYPRHVPSRAKNPQVGPGPCDGFRVNVPPVRDALWRRNDRGKTISACRTQALIAVMADVGRD
jgi:hypothetical protein